MSTPQFNNPGNIARMLFISAMVLIFTVLLSSPSQARGEGGTNSLDVLRINGLPSPQSQGNDILFDDAPDAGRLRLPTDQTIFRARFVTVRFDRLGKPSVDANGSTSQVRPRLTLNLFSDAQWIAQLDQVVYHPSGAFSWVGHLEGVPMSQVVLTVRDEIMFGSLIFPGSVYAIQPMNGVTHVIKHVNQSALPDDRNDTVSSRPSAGTAVPSRPMTDDGSKIDVLVVYTANARATAGGQTQMQTLIDNAITQANNSYGNSGIAFQLRLVTTAEVAYAETGNALTDVNNLQSGSAGLQIAHDLRDAYAADMVALITENLDACGRAFAIMTTPANAYVVVARNCVQTNLSLPHELGHVLGARHDWYADDTNNAPYTFNHGYILTPTLPSPWRTIMSYDDRCVAAGTTCTRIAFWSNPDIFNGANPMGVPAGTSTSCTTSNTSNPPCDADNHQTLNNTAYTVANFRPGSLSPVYVDTAYSGTENGTLTEPYNTLTEGTFRAADGAIVWIKPGNYPETLVLVTKDPRGLVINRPMTLQAINGTVTIGQ